MVRSDADLPLFEHEETGRGQLADAFDDRFRCWNVLVGEILRQRPQREPSFDTRMTKESLQLGRECEFAVLEEVVERFDADPVSGQSQPLLSTIPDGHGKAAVQLRKEFEPFGLEQCRKGFVVRGGQRSTGQKSFPEIVEIVNLAVHHCPHIPTIAENCRTAFHRRLDDEKAIPETRVDTGGPDKTRFGEVGSAVTLSLHHSVQNGLVDRPFVPIHNAADAAHGVLSWRLNRHSLDWIKTCFSAVWEYEKPPWVSRKILVPGGRMFQSTPPRRGRPLPAALLDYLRGLLNCRMNGPDGRMRSNAGPAGSESYGCFLPLFKAVRSVI